jgi:hypothetical protein
MAWFRRAAHPEEQLSAYVDGELDTGARRDVQAHLAACEACSALVDELRQAKSMVASLPRQAPPRSFALGPEYAVARRVAGRRSSVTFAPVAALTVLVALLFVDAANFSGTTSSDETSTSAGAPAAASQAEKNDAAGAPADTFEAPQATPGAARQGAGTPPTPAPQATRPTTESAAGSGPTQPQAASSTADASSEPSRAPQTAESAPTQAPPAVGATNPTAVPPVPQDRGAQADAEEGDDASLSVPETGPEDSSGSLSTLRILEILAAAALLGSLAVVYLPRVLSK